MSKLAVALTAVAVSFPMPNRGEPPEQPEQRIERLATVSEGAVAAARRARCEPPWDQIDEPCRKIWPGSTVELAGLIWSVGYLKSGYARWVHEGRCRTHLGECDAQMVNGVLTATSVSPWQLKRTGHTQAVWPELTGAGQWSTFQAAWAATRVLASGRKICSRWQGGTHWLTATLSAYARGGHCTWAGAGPRASFVMRIDGRLRAELRRLDERDRLAADAQRDQAAHQ